MFWTALGSPRKIRRICSKERVVVPLCQSQGVVEAKDLVTGEKTVVLKNAGYNVEVADFTEGNTLPTFFIHLHQI